MLVGISVIEILLFNWKKEKRKQKMKNMVTEKFSQIYLYREGEEERETLWVYTCMRDGCRFRGSGPGLPGR